MKYKNAKRVQVHIPYLFLLERRDEIIREGINPEVYIDGSMLDNADAKDLEWIHEGFTDAGLTITMHGPYSELNPGSPDETRRLYTASRYERAFYAASHLKPKNMVLHAGYHERRFKSPDEWLSQSMKTWPGFVREAERLGVVIAAENIFEKRPDTLKALVEAVGSPNFRLCIDTGHLNVFSNREMEDWLKMLGPYLAEVHIHDNHGIADDHLPVGEGAIDFRLFFSLLDRYAPDPVYTIEPHGEEMIKRGIKAIEAFLASKQIP